METITATDNVLEFNNPPTDEVLTEAAPRGNFLVRAGRAAGGAFVALAPWAIAGGVFIWARGRVNANSDRIGTIERVLSAGPAQTQTIDIPVETAEAAPTQKRKKTATK